jgi:hypothetical protein
MNLGRETILAGVVGFALGLLAAWAVWSIPQIIPKKEELPPPVSEEVTAPKEFTLTLSEPLDEAILETPEASVAGKTEAGATVVVAGPLGEEVVEATADGTFSTTVSLEEGVNEIVVTAYGKNDQEVIETRTVSYTKEEF